MIPLKIVYTWYGSNTLDRTYIDHWDYPKTEINERNYHLPEYAQKCMEAGNYVGASNYMRLFYLYREGGIYLDTDMEIVKPLEPLVLDDRLKLGSEDERRVNNAILVAPKGHPILLESIKLIESLPIDIRPDLTGPQIVTDILTKRGWKGDKLFKTDDVVSFPHRYFYPYHYTAKFTPDCITPDTYTVHHWSAGWVK